jgi:predicted AAA+ superfamily ATPase
VQKRGRKLYFVDGAVRNAALQRGLSLLSDPGEMGLLLENLVAGHLHALSQVSQVRLYHWQEKDDEVDLLYDHPEQPMAFAIGSSASHHRRGLTAFQNRFPRFRRAAYVVSPGAPAGQPRASGDQVGTVPLDLFLLSVSALAERALAKNLAV